MLEQLETLYQQALKALKNAAETAALEAWYRDTLGRKGSIYLLTRQVGQLSKEERPTFGRRLNEVKKELEAAYHEREAQLKTAELESNMAASAIDVTLPGRPLPQQRP